MKKIMILFLLADIVFLYGCDKKQLVAGGQRDVIVVLSEDDNWSKTKDALKEALERDVFTPNRETIYQLMHGLPENLNSFIYGKNLLLVGYLNGLSEASKLISTLLTDEAQEMVQKRQAFIFDKENPWAVGQYLLVIVSPGKPELKDIIEENKDVIFNYFERASLKRAKWLIYSAGREKQKEKKLEDQFGFSVELPTGFYWKGEDSIKTFVNLVRQFPFRLISIGWKDKEVQKTSFERMLQMRDSIASLYLDKDIIDRNMTKGMDVEFLERKAYKIEGIWKNDEKVMGGPFRTYFFNDSAQKRFYVIDIHVYAPGRKKWFYLKELEAVASTFQTYPVKKDQRHET